MTKQILFIMLTLTDLGSLSLTSMAYCSISRAFADRSLPTIFEAKGILLRSWQLLLRLFSKKQRIRKTLAHLILRLRLSRRYQSRSFRAYVCLLFFIF